MATPTRLTPRQRRSLTDDGYLLVRSLLAGADLARIAARLADHVRQTVAAWAEEPSLDTHGGCVMTRFALDDPGLAPCSEHPLVADAAATVLADGWRPQVLELRAPIPGCGAQGLHTDFGEPAQGLPTWRGLSAMWCISEFTRDNGPLRVIPGSHLVSEPPIDTEHGYATGMGPHPGEVKIIAPAGSLVLFNGPDLWHSGTFNYSPAARLAVTACFAPGPPWGLEGLQRPGARRADRQRRPGHQQRRRAGAAHRGQLPAPDHAAALVPADRRALHRHPLRRALRLQPPSEGSD